MKLYRVIKDRWSI